MHCINDIVVFLLEDKTQLKKLKEEINDLVNTKLDGVYLTYVPKNKLYRFKILAKYGVTNALSVCTDYFGGMGEQHATLTNTTIDHKNRKKRQKFKSINLGLRELGIISNDLNKEDEFDMIGLGRFRSNEDFFEKSKIYLEK